MYKRQRLIARLTGSVVFGESQDLDKIDIKPKTINDVITCMTSNWTQCELAETFMPNLTTPSPRDISPGNYAGSFFPSTRIDDSTPTWAVKLALLRNMFAYFNRYELENYGASPEPEESDLPEDENEEENTYGKCHRVSDCSKIKQEANNGGNVSMQTEWQTVFCAKGRCVFSDTYLHDAFGAAFKREVPEKTDLAPIITFESGGDEEDNVERTEPFEGAWTESVWDRDLGLCGYVEDTRLFGGIVLGCGIFLTVATFALYFYFDSYLFKEQSNSESQEINSVEPPPVTNMSETSEVLGLPFKDTWDVGEISTVRNWV